LVAVTGASRRRAAGKFNIDRSSAPAPSTREQFRHAPAFSRSHRRRRVRFLPAGQHPRAARARELVDILSPTNREWLELAYEAEWAESEKRLGWIEAQGLTKDIHDLAGPEFLGEVKAAHAEYGVALAVAAPAPARPSTRRRRSPK
jgi:hypothetical protein